MSRPTREDRLAEIAGAATREFGRVGYRRTQMARVASDAGVSAGAVYSYVASKEALFHLVFAFGFGRLDGASSELPLATPAMADTAKLIRMGLRESAATPLLRAALEVEVPVDIRAELTALVTERYVTIEQIWPMLAVIERSAADLPDVEELYFRRGRPGYLAQLTRYLERRARTGHLQVTTDTAVAARMMTETITWFAWHRHEDRDADLYDDERARATIVELLCNAFIPAKP
jgi:AcrR family transcriptional regulator